MKNKFRNNKSVWELRCGAHFSTERGVLTAQRSLIYVRHGRNMYYQILSVRI